MRIGATTQGRGFRLAMNCEKVLSDFRPALRICANNFNKSQSCLGRERFEHLFKLVIGNLASLYSQGENLPRTVITSDLPVALGHEVFLATNVNVTAAVEGRSTAPSSHLTLTIS